MSFIFDFLSYLSYESSIIESIFFIFAIVLICAVIGYFSLITIYNDTRHYKLIVKQYEKAESEKLKSNRQEEIKLNNNFDIMLKRNEELFNEQLKSMNKANKTLKKIKKISRV